jgi:geranylgeranyl diphosphate synthase type II
VAEAIRYSLEAGGKRLRPVLTLAAAEAIGAARVEDPPRPASLAEARRLAMPAACALEFIHTYSLIHDDLPAMDDDTLRRGRPTLHVVYGEGIAILAGDGLLTEAFALLARQRADDADAGRRLRVLARIAEAAGVVGMVGGQAIDLESEGTARIPGRTPPALDGPALQDMHARKTGALIRAAAVSGAIVAGGDDHHVEAIDRYATDLGLVFQIVDDILDVTATEDQLGKPAGHDMVEGVYTLPVLRTLALGRSVSEELGDLLGQPLDVVERDKALAIVRSNEGVESAVATARQYVDAAEAVCDRFPTGTAADALRAAPAALLGTVFTRSAG